MTITTFHQSEFVSLNIIPLIIAFTCGILAPVLMIIASQSIHLTAPLGLVGAALALTFRTNADRIIFERQLKDSLKTPLALAASSMLAWIWTRAVTAPEPLHATIIATQLTAVISACWLGIIAIDEILKPKHTKWLVAGLILASGLILIEIFFFFPIRSLFHLKLSEALLNRAVVVISLLSWPASYYLAKTKTTFHAWGLLIAVFLMTLPTFSGAATLGMICGLITLALMFIAPKITQYTIITTSLLTILATPSVMLEINTLIPPELHDLLSGASSKIRVDIWHWFSKAWTESPLLGSGFESTRIMGELTQVKDYPPEGLWALRTGHPHNAILQIWVELGTIGAALSITIIYLILNTIKNQNNTRKCYIFSAFSCTLTISYVSHGAWQMWWFAALGLMIAWFHLNKEKPAS